jgi:hypothetical protein
MLGRQWDGGHATEHLMSVLAHTTAEVCAIPCTYGSYDTTKAD